MSSQAATPGGVSPETTPGHLLTYPRFIFRSLRLATDGSPLFYGWMILLTAICLVGVHAWATQVRDGMVTTNMTDHVSWGLYIANFTFMVGVAAGAVMMVIPAYLYRDDQMHDVVIVGEMLAIAAIIMCLAFVTVDMGRPDRFWHIIPGIGRFNWPISMLTWDVIVLNGYLLLNLHITGYLLYMRFRGQRPARRWYLPFVYLSIGWAVSIHTVTAFLYCGLGGRPLWNTALLAPRFLASAFVSGPAFIILSLMVIRKFGGVQIGDRPTRTLVNIMRITILISLLMVASEVFTDFYSGGSHTASIRYLYFGLDGHYGLVPWIWTSIFLTVTAAILLMIPNICKRPAILATACVFAFIGMWIEKGMGLIVPAFIPSTLHEIVEYAPSLIEWRVTAGIWALGLMVFTVALKIGIPIFTGKESLANLRNTPT
jgi:Ni/Fe-hydrogenase subunit HybB-like protein